MGILGPSKEEIELKKARKKARKIIDEAKDRALEIIAQAEGEEVKKIASQIALSVREAAIAEIKEFGGVLREEAANVIEAEKKAVAEELESYKKAKMIEIDKRAQEIAVDAAKEILGQSLDINQHEEIILKALDAAKKGLI